MRKPSDVFLGIIEFFAVLLPGALVTWMLWRWPWPMPAEERGPFQLMAKIAVPFLPRDPIPRWVAFAVVSWGVGQILFAAAPPIDWVWDWGRHKKRINKGELADSADKAVVALRFALLGLAFPAKTFHQLPWQFFKLESWHFAKPKAIPLIVAILLILPVAALGAYIALRSFCGWGHRCSLWCGWLTSVLVVVGVPVLASWLSYRRKCWDADATAAEKQATREHGYWARQFLRQMNIASFPAPVALSAIKEAAKDTEEAAGMLMQIVNQLLTTGRIATQQISAVAPISPDEIGRLQQAASALQKEAIVLQHRADLADVPLELKAEATIYSVTAHP